MTSTDSIPAEVQPPTPNPRAKALRRLTGITTFVSVGASALLGVQGNTEAAVAMALVAAAAIGAGDYHATISPGR
ncbi:hypothetical protein ACM614_03500 [Streptomyces sp. 12297]|uniref:hypothetical protein n=1 Tax=Streptomyces sp. NBC_00239 TaxID=2903640 RepID=UPI002E2E01ED|nr:hypothetical protein [Streptomyces sp. NBC_00239]